MSMGVAVPEKLGSMLDIIFEVPVVPTVLRSAVSFIPFSAFAIARQRLTVIWEYLKRAFISKFDDVFVFKRFKIVTHFL